MFYYTAFNKTADLLIAGLGGALLSDTLINSLSQVIYPGPSCLIQTIFSSERSHFSIQTALKNVIFSIRTALKVLIFLFKHL